MATKTLYVLVHDAGDGSYHPAFTFNSEWITEMEEKHDSGELDYDSGWSDGDGFHYTTLQVPEECTLKSLGIHYDAAVNR
jgi:hypothetical protein